MSFTIDATAPTATVSGQPSGTNNTTTLDVTVAGTGVTHYKHKVITGTTCTTGGYGSETAVATKITDSISSLADGSISLCVIGKDSAGNWQAEGSATRAGWTKDATAPTVTASSGGSLLARTVSATDGDTGTTSWKYKIIDSGDSCDATEMASGTSDYTEGEDEDVAASDNGKKACFSSTDAVGNVGYGATGVLSVSGAVPAGVWSPTDGSSGNDNTINVTVDFTEALYSDNACANVMTNTTADDVVKLGTTDGGDQVAKAVTYDSTNFTITMNPSSDLADDVYYAEISNAWYYSNGACAQGASSKVSFTIDTTAPTASVSGQPTGTNNTTTLDVTVAGTGVTHYKHKVITGTSCTTGGYGSETAVATKITDSISSLAEGSISLCVIGKDSTGNWQSEGSGNPCRLDEGHDRADGDGERRRDAYGADGERD